MRYHITNTRAEWLPMYSPLERSDMVTSPLRARALAPAWAVHAAVSPSEWGVAAFYWWWMLRSIETLHYRAAFAARNNTLAALGC